MDGSDTPGFRYDAYFMRSVHAHFEPAIRVRRADRLERSCSPDRAGSQAILGLRVISCFSNQRPTLTADDISALLDLPIEEVSRIASRLTNLGYLRRDASSIGTAWTLMPDDDNASSDG